jgi:hypothetical protein
MSVLVGLFLALPGGLAALAGLSGRRRARHLRRTGVPAWAMAVSPPASAGEEPGGPPHRTLIQYELADGRVLEQISSAPIGKAGALTPGQKVLVWYDPQDPREILVYGRDGRGTDLAFVAVGALFMLAGLAIAIIG